ISGSPVTGIGTLTATLNSQTANLLLASPNGSSGVPSFRALVTADVPTGTSGAVIPLLTGLNTWNTDQNFTGHAQSTANCSYPAGTFPCWYNDNKGVAIVQDSTARYGFTSIADLVQSGAQTI